MATVTAGNSVSVTISGDQTVAVNVTHNNSGRIQFTPTNSGSVMGDAGIGRSFGPLPMSATYGPFGVAGTLTVFCDAGTVTYTVNDTYFPNNVGIGTNAPSAKLHVAGVSPFVRAQDTASLQTGFQAVNSSGNVYLAIENSTPGLAFNSGVANARLIYSDGAYPLMFFTNATARATIDASGNLLVGTTAIEGQGGVSVLPNSSQGATRIAWNRVGTTNTTFALDFKDNSVTVGSVSYTNTATAYNTASDYRLKLDQKPLTGSGAFIDALKPKTWSWSADGSRGVGFIAHEVQEISPTTVTGEKDAMRVEQYEISPAVPAVLDEEGNVVTPAVEAVMGEREVPAYQSMEYGSAEFIANIIAELQSLRKRVAALEAGK